MPRKEQSIKSDLARAKRHRITPAEYEEAPELTAEELAQATVVRRGRPSLGDAAKVPVYLRLDRDVVETYRKTGRGWQGRINETLRRSAERLKRKA